MFARIPSTGSSIAPALTLPVAMPFVAVLFVAVLFVAGLAGNASAQDAPGSVNFDVQVIHAVGAAGAPDPALGKLQKYLQKSFSRYKSFKQLDKLSGSATSKAAATFKLPDGKTLTLSYAGVARGFVKVHLELDTLKTTLDIKDGGLFFQAGRVFKGGILVLAITARTRG